MVGKQVEVRRVAAGAAGIGVELEDADWRRLMLVGGAGHEGLEGSRVQGGLAESHVRGGALRHPSTVVRQLNACDVRPVDDGDGAVVVGGGWADEGSRGEEGHGDEDGCHVPKAREGGGRGRRASGEPDGDCGLAGGGPERADAVDEAEHRRGNHVREASSNVRGLTSGDGGEGCGPENCHGEDGGDKGQQDVVRGASDEPFGDPMSDRRQGVGAEGRVAARVAVREGADYGVEADDGVDGDRGRDRSNERPSNQGEEDDADG